jgi:hypothetical protein
MQAYHFNCKNMKLKLFIVLLFSSVMNWGQTTISYDFSSGGAVPGLNQAAPGISLDANIGFGSFKNSGTSNPGIFSSQLRLYQNATKGGSIMVYASNGVIITQVRVFASGTTGPAAFSVDGGASSSLTISAGVYTMSSLSSTNNVEFWCTGTSSGTRIYVDSFEVTYTSGVSTYNVTYDGNGNDSGSVPVDATAYNSGDSVTVLSNTGGLGLTGYTFNGWNTSADGSGTAYVAGNTFSISANTTLFAQWLNTSPPVITSSLTASGNVGSAFTYDMVATNSPTSYNAIGLPSGLSINTTTGQISGTPTAAGVFNVTISATNAYGTDSETLEITFVVGPCLSSTFTGWSYAYGDWTHSENGTWTAVGSFAGSGQIQMNDIGDYLELPPLNNATSMEYDAALSSSPSGNNRIKVQYYDGSFWVDVQEDTCTSTTFSTVSVSFPLAVQSASNVRVRLYRSADNRTHYIDNLKVYCGTPANPEIDVQGNGVSIVNGDATPSLTDHTDFGTTIIGNDVSQTFTIYNAGPDDLDVSSITITGVDAGDFYISVNPASTIVSGGSTTFEVTFSPTIAATSYATINIDNNDGDENPYIFDIVAVSVLCSPTTSVTSMSPTSGPVGTVVTINGSGFSTATNVSFGAYASSFTIVSSSIIEATVPVGAASGDILIEDAGGCQTSFPTFTVIKEDNSSCEGIAVTTDLIIYDLHDEYTGDGGFITIYNGTASTVDMADYSLWRTSIYGDGNEIDYATLTGTIASGTLGVIRVNTVGCGPVGTNGTIDAGFNGDDQIQLRNAAGTVVIDDVHAYFDKGYYMVRNAGALSARTTFVASDWSITPLAAGECWPSAGLVLPSGGAVPPTVNTQPSYTPSCASTSATLTTSGSEGFVGSNPLAYQWFYAAPGSASWTAVVDGGIYSGATMASLSISDISGVINYQYYCQIRENTVTCYSATNAVKITDTNATTWNGTDWSNGIPDATKFATINGNYDTALHGSFECCSLLVNATYTLDIQANNYVEVTNDITNNGTLNVMNNGSLVQINDLGVNTGNISYRRATTGVPLDYVYWSSPVDGVNTPTGYIYTWNPDVLNPNGGQGNWVAATNTLMQPAVGYIMRGVLSRNFVGVPRNGVYTPTIKRGSNIGAGSVGPNGIMRLDTDDNWNLLGNPYPSAISIGSFLAANTEIDGFVRLWTHGTLPSTSAADPFYDNFVSNYTATDYIAINGAGATSGSGTLSVIGGGQSFFVLMNPGTAVTSTALFNNSMRDKGYSNSQFYRNANILENSAVGGNIERHRIWLDLVTPTQTIRTLVAYVEGATQEKDRMFDAITDYKSSQNFYSLIDTNSMTIQGRALPFDSEDKVPLGFKTNVAGNFTIALAEVDGLFTDNQNIYLEDLELGIIHDLKSNPYAFSATAGINNSRFVLRYTNETLGNDDFENNSNVLVSISNTISIHALKDTIQSVHIHNVLGQDLLVQKGINASLFEISSLQKNTVPLIVQITLSNGVVITKKIIY